MSIIRIASYKKLSIGVKSQQADHSFLQGLNILIIH
jgi:hypothetical protein